MTSLHWNRRSTRAFSHALHAVGWAASPRSLGYALRRNRKAIAPATHPRRDEQFEHIAALRAVRIPAGRPAVSLDSNKKELIGRLLNHGVARTEEPVEVFDHDFPS